MSCPMSNLNRIKEHFDKLRTEQILHDIHVMAERIKNHDQSPSYIVLNPVIYEALKEYVKP